MDLDDWDEEEDINQWAKAYIRRALGNNPRLMEMDDEVLPLQEFIAKQLIEGDPDLLLDD